MKKTARKGLLLLGSLLMSSTVLAATTTPANWKFLRQDEDWSKYYNNDFKHIKLNEKGDYWVSVGGHVRYRGEFWNNVGFNDANDDAFHLGRALLHADFHLGSNWRIFTEIKTANSTDRALPGGRRPLDVDTFDLQQAFVDYSAGKSRFRIGRQALSFGRQRLVSPLPWGNTLRTWEGARYDYLGDTWQTTAFATRFVPVRQYDRNRSDKNNKFAGIYTKGKINRWRTDFYVYNSSDQGDRNLFTWGSLIERRTRGWDFNAELAIQTGTDAQDRDVSAAMLGAELGFKIDHDVVKRVSVGVDYGSGDDNPNDNDNNTFDQLFPLGHAYLGFADHIGRRNVVAANIATNLRISQKVTTKVALHTFYKAEKEDAIYNAGGIAIRPGNANGSSHIGNEIDVVTSYKHDRHTKVDVGLSYIKSGDAINETANDANVAFAYISVNYLF